MLKIGEFSKLSRGSIRMLEVYDDRERLEEYCSVRRSEKETGGRRSITDGLDDIEFALTWNKALKNGGKCILPAVFCKSPAKV